MKSEFLNQMFVLEFTFPSLRKFSSDLELLIRVGNSPLATELFSTSMIRNSFLLSNSSLKLSDFLELPSQFLLTFLYFFQYWPSNY